MNRHRKSRRSAMLTWPLAVACIGVCFIFIFGGWLLLRQSEEANADRKVDPSATTSLAKHYPGLTMAEIPAGIPSQIKEYEGFNVSFNKDNRTPNWVAWELLASETDGAAHRSNYFWQDTELTDCPTTNDYKGSGYDRGHMCPAADQKWSEKAMEDCFVMANMCPQNRSLNSGAWGTLENKCRQWARRDSALVIVAGPIYEAGDKERIGYAGVRVPGAFFKVIAAPYLNEPRGIAFVYPNMSAPGNMQNYAMTIDEVEELTGYDFFAALPDEVEKEVESTASFKLWNAR